MSYTRKFIELTKNDADVAGGKGASLGEMLNHNIPVPDGFVVTAQTFDRFLEETDLTQEVIAILSHVDTKAIHTIDKASDKIQTFIKSALMPKDITIEILSHFDEMDIKYVAVRSSATAEDGADHAWAGQLDSYLNVTKENVLEMVQSCWASLFTPRAIFYRYEKGLHTTHISVAVVVQKMINSEKSGIAFSVHPVTEDHNQIIIEAGLGLGEAIVSGSVTPDSYVTTKDPHEIIDININTQNKALYRGTVKTEHGFNEWKDLPNNLAEVQVLSEKQIIELSNIIINIENHYGFPCDIEWAFEDEIFYIVQSRPITTLKKVLQESKIIFEKIYTRDYSYLIEENWFSVSKNIFKEKFGLVNPHDVPVIFHSNDGVIEVWENLECTRWLLDTLQKQIIENEQVIINAIDEYEQELENIKKYWDNPVFKTKDEFLKFVEYVYSGMFNFDIMYYSGYDERTPQHIRDRVLKIRDEDIYFDKNDTIIRENMGRLYPRSKGYETVVLLSELENIPDIEVLKKRKQHSILFKEEIILGTIQEFKVKHPEYDFIIEQPPEDSSTLIGQVGNKGYAKGVVHIIKRKDQINDITEGEILVSMMTSPEFVPAMEKAAAIITDEGGITCHAGIVARELNKPCIIGTKFATQILKDGDLVEVDADNGIVKILKQDENKYNLKDKDEYIKVVKRPYPPLLISSIIKGQMIPEYFDHFVPEWSSLNQLVIVDGEDIYYVKEEMAVLGKEMFTAFHDKETFETSIQLFEEQEKVLLDSTNSTLEEFLTQYEKYTPALQVLTIQGLIKDSLEEKLKEKTSEGEALKIMDTLNIPLRDNGYKIEMKELIETDDLKSHVAKYEYMGARYGSREGYTVEKALEKKKNLNIKKLQQEDIEEKEKIKKAIKRAKDILNIKDGVLVDVMQWVVYYRTQRTDILNRSSFDAYSLFVEKAKELNISYEQLLMCTRDEVFTNNIPEIEILKKRKEGYSIINHGSDLLIYHGAENQEIIEYFEDDFENITEVKGQAASKGIIQGIVRNIGTINDIGKLREGDVLVTSMTTPDMVSAMGRAVAFVTDEGGITCHAAIMSRELKKTCIIGTEFGTKVLHDGDLVEVDADNGIVRILEKAQKKTKNSINILTDLDLNDYEFIGKWENDIFSTDMWMEWFDQEKTDALGFFEIKEPKILVFNGGNFFWNNKMISANKKIIERAIKTKDSKIFENLETQAKETFLRVMKETDILAKEDPTPENFKKFTFLARELVYYWNLGASMSNNIDDYIIDSALENNIAAEDVLSYIKIPHTELSKQQVELKEFYKIFKQNGWLEKISDSKLLLDEIKNTDEKLFLKLKKHVDIYGWIEIISYLGDPMTMERLLYSISRVEIKDELIIPETDSQDFKHVLEIASHITYAKQAGAEYSSIFSYKLLDYLNKTADALGITYESMLNLVPSEIIDYMTNKTDFSNVLKNRENRNWLTYINNSGEKIIYSNKEKLEELYKIAVPRAEAGSKQVTGQTGNNGKTTGRVKIIMSTQDFYKMEDDDVLVTTMTTPDFIILMQKSSAIVTDIGGLLSHASIVSRELGIPCVIGTKIATKVFKDGDLVEVDADSGVVRILESKNIDLSYFDNFVFQASRPQNLQRDEVLTAMYKIFNLDSRFVTIPFEGRQRGFYIDKDFENKMYTLLLKKVDTREKFQDFLKAYDRLGVQFKKDIINYESSKLSKNEISDLLINFNQNLINFGEHIWIPYAIEKYLDNSFFESLKKTNPQNYQEIYEAVSNITELTDYHKMRLKICEAIILEKDYKQIAKELTDSYYWSSEYSFIEPFLDENHFISELEKLSLDNAKKEKYKIFEIESVNKKLFKEAIQKISDKKTRLDAEVINKYIFLRTDRVDVFRRLIAPARNLLEQVATLLKKETKLPWEYLDIVNLSNEEIQNYLTKNIIPDLNYTRERTKNYVFISDKKDTRIIDEPEQVKLISSYIKNQANKSQEIKGKIAYKGKIVGKVSLVFSKEDLLKVNKGDILVARTTMVDYTPVMEIAAAFVTAEGGITSHAAIVSRELQKPCIVGTSNCMELLNDGDLIEVDADNGVVTILEKKDE